MSDNPMTSDTQTPGQRLVAARERAGLSQEQVAQELKIQLKKIQALEEDNYHQLFSEVFARGYLRSCAKLLHLDGEELVRLYDTLYAGDEEEELPANDSLDLPFKSASPWPRRILLIVAIVLLWALAYWYFTPPEGGDENATAASANATQTAAAQPEVPAGLDHGSISSSSAASIAPAVSPGLADNTTGPPTEGADNSLDTLELAFEQECWLEVLDARGDALAAELQLPGSRLTLAGEAPFSVKLGNHAQGVSAWVNGEPQDLPTRAATAVATFQLDAD